METMPVMPAVINWLPFVMIGGILISIGIVAFAVIRAFRLLKKNNLTLDELDEIVAKQREEERAEKERKKYDKK